MSAELFLLRSQVRITSSLSVNWYRWINIWTAILGHIFISLPAFFDAGRIHC